MPRRARSQTATNRKSLADRVLAARRRQIRKAARLAHKDELPVFDFRSPVGWQTRSPHGRLNPYDPTTQFHGKYALERGNPPGGIPDKMWENWFNKVNSRVYDPAKREHGKIVANELMRKAREDGTIRDLTIDALIDAGIVGDDFVDSNP